VILKKWLPFLNDLDKTSESFIPELEEGDDVILYNLNDARFVLSNMFSILRLFSFFKVTLLCHNVLFYSHFLQHGFFKLFLKSRKIVIKSKKNIFFRHRFLKYKNFKMKFVFNFLFKFKKTSNFFKKKNSKIFLKKINSFKLSFNFTRYHRLFFFYLKEYPLTGYFFNKSSFPLVSALDGDYPAFTKNLNFSIPRSSRQINNLLSPQNFKFFKKLILTKFNYLFKKKTFWNFYFKIKKFTENSSFFELIESHNLPFFQVNLSVSSNYKRTFYNLDKIVFFSLELMVDIYYKSK